MIPEISDTAYIFDFDDTLIYTSAKIIVRNKDNNSIIRTLSTKIYNNLNNRSLPNNEYYDYSEFNDTNLLMHEKSTNCLNILKALLKCKYNCFILTSREHPIDIFQYLYKKKIVIPGEHIICTNQEGTHYTGSDGERKLQAIIDLYNKGFRNFHIWEDSEEFKHNMEIITEKVYDINLFFHNVNI